MLEDLCAEEGPQSDLLADLFGLLAKRYPWREYSHKSFRHWVAGNLSQSAFADVRIATNDGQVMVKENERLSAEQVQKILAAYAKGEKRPDEFAWRETTANFS
jgi:hypothetical protein